MTFTTASNISAQIIEAADASARALCRLRFAEPVAQVYCPLVYARAPFANYVQQYASNQEVILLGMNPGPWGMCQTGVPFGEVNIVRDWLGIKGEIVPPRKQHPRVPVMGWGCHRCEVSGSRLWGWARETFGTPAQFFERFFVLNYCPLIFLEDSGRNRTPDKLPLKERELVTTLCDAALRRMVEAIGPKYVIGVGNFAEARARQALSGMGVQIGRILHPSPASPAANGNWAKLAAKQLKELGVRIP